jgi:CheY-like chemotaxis protein/anti-sigma regulatory factor (Ser/Thr protein kinase)
MLGHELRGPLRSLLGLLDREPATARRRAMRRTVVHALRLAEDGLAWGRLAGGPVPLRSEPFALEELLADVFDTVRVHARPGVQCVVDVAPALAARWEGDAGRLRQILTNLLVNALDHTHEGHVVLALAPADPEGLAIAVRDSGPGIPFTQRERVLEPFVQGGDSPGQAGLGLAIVDELVRALGGGLACDAAPDRGTTFTVTLPWQPRSAPPAPSAAASGRRVLLCDRDALQRHAVAGPLLAWGMDVDEAADAGELAGRLADGPSPALALLDERAVLEGALATALREAGTPILVLGEGHGPGTLPRPVLPATLARAVDRLLGTARDAAVEALQVLVVDDHPLARSVLGETLAGLGHVPTAAADGTEALALAADPAARFDWVLLDRNMPGLDGIATATALRGRPATRRARLALLVNEGGAVEDHERLLMDDVFVRPAGAAALAAGLRRLLERPAGPGRHHRDGGEDDLAALRDETLREDLAALEAAWGAGDGEAVDDHLHRMTGALRMCPEPALEAARGRLADALTAANPEAVGAALERLRSLLGSPTER